MGTEILYKWLSGNILATNKKIAEELIIWLKDRTSQNLEAWSLASDLALYITAELST